MPQDNVICDNVNKTRFLSINEDGSINTNLSNIPSGISTSSKQDEILTELKLKADSTESQLIELVISLRALINALINPPYLDKSANAIRNQVQSGTAATGDRICTFCAIDGSDKYTVILLIAHTSTICQELIVQI